MIFNYTQISSHEKEDGSGLSCLLYNLREHLSCGSASNQWQLTNRRSEGAGKGAERSNTIILKERKQWRVGK